MCPSKTSFLEDIKRLKIRWEFTQSRSPTRYHPPKKKACGAGLRQLCKSSAFRARVPIVCQILARKAAHMTQSRMHCRTNIIWSSTLAQAPPSSSMARLCSWQRPLLMKRFCFRPSFGGNFLHVLVHITASFRACVRGSDSYDVSCTKVSVFSARVRAYTLRLSLKLYKFSQVPIIMHIQRLGLIWI